MKNVTMLTERKYFLVYKNLLNVRWGDTVCRSAQSVDGQGIRSDLIKGTSPPPERVDETVFPICTVFTERSCIFELYQFVDIGYD